MLFRASTDDADCCRQLFLADNMSVVDDQKTKRCRLQKFLVVDD